MEDNQNQVVVGREGTWADYMNQPEPEQVQEETPEVKEEVVQETSVQEPIKETVQEVQPEIKEEVKETPVKTWEEVLSDNGFDEFDIELLKFKKATGDITPYLEVKTVNYKDMPAEEIMKRDLRKQYPTLSEKALEYKFKEEVLSKYKLLDSFDEEEQSIGRELLEFDANVKREKLIEEQAKFKAPIKDTEAEAKAYQEQQLQAKKQWEETIKSNQATQSLMSNKKLVLDGGEEYKFNLQVDSPEELVRMIADPNEYNKHILKDGQPDFNKMLLVSAMTRNPELVIKSLIDYGKSLGQKEEVEDQHNLSKQSTPTPAKSTESLFEALANRGVHSKMG